MWFAIAHFFELPQHPPLFLLCGGIFDSSTELLA
jgi:hypothetical protein